MAGAWVKRRSGSIAAAALVVTLAASVAGAALELANGANTQNFATAEDRVLLVAFLAMPLVGLFLMWRRPDNAVGWLLGSMGVLAGLYALGHAWAVYGLRTEPGALPGAGAAAWSAGWLLVPTVGLLPFVAACFPSGRIERHSLHRFGRVAAGALAAVALAQAFAPEELDAVGSGVRPIPNPVGVEGLRATLSTVTAVGALVVVAFGVAAVVDAVSRFRRSTGAEREQLRWVAVALAIIPVTTAVAIPIPGSEPLLYAGQISGLVGIAAAIAIAVLRFRLYDLGDFVRRTAAYAALSAAVVGAVVVLASLVGVLFSQGGLVPAVAAAATVAIALGPLRSRLQSGVDRLLYGRRNEPFNVLTDLGNRLESSVDPDTALAVIVATTATNLKLPYVAIEVDLDDARPRSVRHGSPTSRVTRMALVHQHQPVGDLIVGHRSSDEAFNDDELQLFRDLARQTATVVHAMTVTEALQHARQQLVTSREEERRRLRRDLHDGLGPTLAGAGLQLDVLAELIRDGPVDAANLVEKLRDHVRLMVDDVRRVSHGLRPPALDDLGLAAALREQVGAIAGAQLDVHLALPGQDEGIPAAVEVAVFRIASEALTNVVRHARATVCTVRLTIDDAVDLQIIDDGIGVPDGSTVGVGLVSMRERARELGGTVTIERAEPSGTVVHARLPLPR